MSQAIAQCNSLCETVSLHTLLPMLWGSAISVLITDKATDNRMMETGCAPNHSLRPKSWKALQQKLSGCRTNGGQQVTFGDTSDSFSVSARGEAMRVRMGYVSFLLPAPRQ
jgi:hypothetical protein